MKLKKAIAAAALLAMVMQLLTISAAAAGSFTFEAENCSLTRYARIVTLDSEDISGGKYVGYLIQPTARFDVTFSSAISGNLYITPYAAGTAEGVFTAELNGTSVSFETKPTSDWRVFEKQKAFCLPVVKGQNTLAITTLSGGANFDYFEVNVLGETEKPEVEINTFENVEYLQNTEEERLLTQLGIVGEVNTKQEFITRGEFAHMAAGMKVDRSYIDSEVVTEEIPPMEFVLDDSSKFTLISGSGSITTQWDPPALYNIKSASRFKITGATVNLDDYDTITFRYGSDYRLVHTTESLFAYIDNDPAKVIASVVPKAAANWDEPIDLSVKLNGKYSGVHDIYFSFTPNSHTIRVESVTFENSVPRSRITYKGADGEKSVNYQAEGNVFADVKTDTPYVNEIEYLKDCGIITDSVRYRPADTITLGEAVRIVMGVLGYSDETVDDYVIKATQLGLLKGVSYDLTQDLTMKQALKLLTNALTAESLEIAEISASGIGYSTDNTVLDSLFGVKKIKNKQVTATVLTSLDSANTSLSEGMIALDEVSYKTLETGFDFLIGFKVNAYVKDDKIITLTPAKSNNLVRITPDENADASEGYIKAKTDGKTKTYNFEDEPRVFLNGRAYTKPLQDNTEILKPKVGGVYLLAPDGNTKYGVIFVESFDMKVVANAETEAKKLLFSDNSTLDFDEEGVVADFYAGGEKAYYESVNRDSVLAIGKNGDRYVIHILKNAVTEGYVAATGTNKIVLGTNTFETLEGVVEAAGVNLGDEVAAYIAPGGKIFAFAFLGNNYRENIGLIIDCEPLSKRGTNYYEVLMLTTGGEKIWFNTTSEITVNGDEVILTDELSETSVIAHGWNGGEYVQPVKYKLNSEGEITAIFTSDGEDADLKFNTLTSEIYAYDSSISFYNVRLENAVMFQIASSDRGEDVNDEKYYQLGEPDTTLKSEFLVFGLDESNKAAIVISKYVEKDGWSMSTDRGDNMLVFDEAIEVVETTENDEYTGQLIFYYESGKHKSIFAPDKDGKNLADDLKRGDMFLVVSKDANGFATEKEVYASPQSLTAGSVITYSTTHDGNNSYDRYTLSMYCGKVVGRKGAEATVWVQNGNSSMDFDENYLNTRTIGFVGCNVYIYDMNEDEITVAGENDIAVEDFVVFREKLASVKDIVIIRNYE